MPAPMYARLPCLCAVTLLVAACGDAASAGPARTPQPPRRVTLVAAAAAELPRSVQVHGVLVALDELVAGFQVPGRLATLRVDLGDTVKEGDEIAALDRRDFELEQARATAALRQTTAQLGLESDDEEVDIAGTASVREAEAVLADARLNRDRVHQLVQQSLSPPADLDAANAVFAIASSRLQRARDQVRTWIAELAVRRQELQIADKRMADATIRAPWPGRIAARHVAVGQYLAAGSPVVTLLRTDPLRLRLEVPERQAWEVSEGQRVEFTVDGSEESFAGTVQRLGSAIDRSKRTLLVEAAVDNRDGRLLPGGFCRATIVVAANEPVVVVPAAAVASFAGVDRVFVVEDGKAKEVLVSLGRRTADAVEIRAGVTAGTKIVAEPGDLVRGTPVVVAGS